MSSPRMTITVQLVLRALLAYPDREMYGFEIIRGSGLQSGTVYPVLGRLEDAGWLSARGEVIDPHAEKRPPRRYYRLTADGLVQAREAMGHAAVQLAALGIADAARVPAEAAEGSPVRKPARRVREKPAASPVGAVVPAGPDPVETVKRQVEEIVAAKPAPVASGCPPHPKRRVLKGFCSACKRGVLPGEKVA